MLLSHCVLCKRQAHKGLTQMLKKYTFVGMVDLHLSLLQFNTKLVLVNHTELRRETPLTYAQLGRRATSPACRSQVSARFGGLPPPYLWINERLLRRGQKH